MGQPCFMHTGVQMKCVSKLTDALREQGKMALPYSMVQPWGDWLYPRISFILFVKAMASCKCPSSVRCMKSTSLAGAVII